MSIRDAYIEKMKLQLEELTATMNELQKKTGTEENELHEKYLKEMASLREQSELALDKLYELKMTGEESWKSIVAETEKVSDAFVKSFHFFKSQL